MTEVAPKPKVFLSYASQSRAWTQEFSRLLQQNGLQVFLVDFASTGEDWEETTRRGLQESDAVIVPADSDSATRPEVLFELGAAMAGDKAVIFVGGKESRATSVRVPLRAVAEVQRQSPASTAAEVARVLERLGLPHGNGTP